MSPDENVRKWPVAFNPNVFEFEIAIPGRTGNPFRQARLILPRDFDAGDVETLTAILHDLAERPMFPEATS